MHDYIAISKKWAREFVVDMKLCPFAKKPLDEGKIDWQIIDSVAELDKIIDGFLLSELRSTFVILPFLEDFESFLDVLGFAEHLREVLGYAEDIKFVPFHPKNRYEGGGLEDEINYANRAPFPTIQLLRSQDLSDLKMTESWKADILDANEGKMKTLGREKLRQIFNEFRK